MSHDPDYWKFSNEDGKLDRQYGGGGKHSDFVKSVEEAVAYSKEIERNPLAALTPAQLAAIRAVILETIDDHYWTFYENDLPPDPDEPNKPTEIANMHRLLFCDAVAANIVARGAPATVSRTTISERRCKGCGELYSPDEDGAESICSVCATVRGK